MTKVPMQRPQILLIEDDPDILELIEYNLVRARFRVLTAANGEAGLEALTRLQPDLMVLDLMLPGMDGLEVCKTLRRNPQLPQIPIIMLTAKGEESDVVVGLELGADDYMTKPFSPSELIARIKAVLRRHSHDPENLEPVITLGPVRIDPNRYEVTFNGSPLMLTLSEFKILTAMARRPGKVFSRERLLNFLTEENSILIDRNIDVHVRSIRRKLKESAFLIHTVRGIGYKCQDYVESFQH